MNTLDENDKKLDLLEQIDKYRDEGYDIRRYCSISDDFNELRFQLALTREKKRKFHIDYIIKYIFFLLNSTKYSN